MPTTKLPIRQGDVLLIPTDRIPKGVTPAARDKHGRLILALGDVTGHAHAILDDPATLFVQADLDELADRFLRVEQDVTVTHEEHDDLPIPAGDYIVRVKREYAPEAPVYVAD